MRTYIVDSFTNQPFKGNPAGVCLVDHPLSDAQMQQIALEFGLSETAFLLQQPGEANIYNIRYFSPKKEIPLCGHATLASAKVLFSLSNLKDLHFITVENINLPVTKQHNEIVMEFPVYDTSPLTVPDALLAALGITELTNTAFSIKNKIILLEIPDSVTLAQLKPDFTALVKSYLGINGVLVTAPSADIEFDYQYRYFWPWAGTNEDPVTGGVQTFLAKYWSVKLGKTTMKAFQSSARTGYMHIELKTDKVLISSDAVIILEGNLVAFKA